MRDLSIDVPGGRLHGVEQGGPGDPPIILLHAGIADLRSWDDLAPRLAGRGYRVVRYDRRAYGLSTTEDVEYSNRADALAVLDHIGARQAVLVGNSQGGQIALDTAIEAPDRVAAVVGVAAGLGGFEGTLTAEEERLFDEMEALEEADPADPAAIAEIDVRVWVDGPGQRDDRVAARIREAVRSMDEPLYRAERIAGRPIPLTPPAHDRVADLRCPVLAVAGELDVSEVVQTARHLEAHAPDARALIWPDVAHMIGMEVPERLADAIVEFVERIPRWS
jgi:3-oxoadipate enol-lactonase